LSKLPTKLEQAKLASAAEETPANGLNPVGEHRRAREKELLDAWGRNGPWELCEASCVHY